MAKEGSWLGPDKLAHFFFVPAITFSLAFLLGNPKLWVCVASGLGVGWEISNHIHVFSGERGCSMKDLIAFLLGGIVSGLIVLAKDTNEAVEAAVFLMRVLG